MGLSRYQASGSVQLFRDTPRHEAIFDSKGMLITQHQLPNQVVLTVVNFHTTAGGVIRHPQDRRTEGIQARQIAHVVEHVSHLSSPLIVGEI